MSENRANSNNFREAVCIEAQRIFDSCSDKDCLEDLEVIFTDGAAKTIIDNATFIKCKNVEVKTHILQLSQSHSIKDFIQLILLISSM